MIQIMSGLNIITIDGPAGSGKSTLAKGVAQVLNLPYLDTGAMFRAIALYLGDGSWDWEDKVLSSALKKFRFSLRGNDVKAVLTLNNQTLGCEIRQEKIGNWASNLGKIKTIRDFLKKSQQDIGTSTSLVCEGRDMGTVVFPRARWKFFLQASDFERARRRWQQLISYGQKPDFDQVFEGIQARDLQDQQREFAPLKPAEDALIIDTTELSINEVKEKILDTVYKEKKKTNT